MSTKDMRRVLLWKLVLKKNDAVEIVELSIFFDWVYSLVGVECHVTKWRVKFMCLDLKKFNWYCWMNHHERYYSGRVVFKSVYYVNNTVVFIYAGEVLYKIEQGFHFCGCIDQLCSTRECRRR